jgi:hypothetical protein
MWQCRTPLAPKINADIHRIYANVVCQARTVGGRLSFAASAENADFSGYSKTVDALQGG